MTRMTGLSRAQCPEVLRRHQLRQGGWVVARVGRRGRQASQRGVGGLDGPGGGPHLTVEGKEGLVCLRGPWAGRGAVLSTNRAKPHTTGGMCCLASGRNAPKKCTKNTQKLRRNVYYLPPPCAYCQTSKVVHCDRHKNHLDSVISAPFCRPQGVYRGGWIGFGWSGGRLQLEF